MAPNVSVHFWNANDINGSTILEIDDEDEYFRAFKITPDLYGLGGWELTLARRVGFALFDSGAVQPEVFVRFLIHAWSDTEYYFGGSLQKRNQVVVHRDEQGAEEFIFGGPGPKSYMDRYRLGIEQLTGTGWNLDLDNGVWRWNETATAGRVLNRVIAEDAAADDPALPDLTKTFGDANDSDSVAWANDVAGAGEYEIPIGQSLLATIWDLEDLSELFTVINLGSVGSPLYQLEAFQSYGTDVTGSSPGAGVGLLREGLNIANDSLTVEGVGIRKCTHVIVEGKDGAWAIAVGTAWSPGEYVKWGKIEYSRSSNVNILERAGLRWIRRQENGERQITVEIAPGASEATGFYFPGPGEVLWPGNTITLDTAEDGSTHTPLDFNNEDELLTGLDITLGPAGDTATADKKAKSWDVKVRLNWERAGFAGAPDQTSAASGNSGCKCQQLCTVTEPGDAPSIHDAAIGVLGNNTVHAVSLVVGSGANRAIYALVTNEANSVTTVKWYPQGGTSPTEDLIKIGEIIDLHSQGFTQRMSLWRLLNPTTETSGSKVQATKSGSLVGGIAAWSMTDVDQTSPEGSVVSNANTGATSSIAVPHAAHQTALNGVGWIWSNATGIADPVAAGTQTQDFSDSFNNSAGRGDIGMAGGHGAADPSWTLGASRDWMMLGVTVNGAGGAGGGNLPEDVGQSADAGNDPCAAHGDHVHSHGNQSGSGTHAHDTTQIAGLDQLSDLIAQIEAAVAVVWHPVMAQDPSDDKWYVVVDGDGQAVMAQGG